MRDTVIPALTVQASRSYDGLDHIIPEQVIVHPRQPRRCSWCAIEFIPTAINSGDARRQRFCGKACKARQSRATQIAKQSTQPNHLREVIIEQLGRLTPRSAAEVHSRVVGVWGKISDRAICRHLSRLNRDGVVRRTPDGYLLAPAQRQTSERNERSIPNYGPRWVDGTRRIGKVFVGDTGLRSTDGATI